MTDHRDRAVTVASVAEALSHLATQRGRARIVAGLAGLRRGLSLPDGIYLVDVSEVAALRRVEQVDGGLLLGSAVHLAALAQHPEVAAIAPMLAVAAARNTEAGLGAETLGARIVSARGGDAVNVALVALGAQAEITNLTGAQWLPLAPLFVRQGVSRVDSSAEILTRVRLPAWEAVQGVGMGVIPGEDECDSYTLALAVALDEGGGRFAEARLAHGSDWMTPSSLSDAAKMLVGVALDDKGRLHAFVVRVIEQGMATLGEEPRGVVGEEALREACHRALKGAARMARRRLAAFTRD